jgi:hypothetical protein
MSDRPSDLTIFLRVLGTNGLYDTVPCSNTDFFLDKVPGESSRQRLLAWMRIYVLRGRGRKWKGADGKFADYAVDEKGNPLGIARLAADLGWKVEYAREVWRECVAFGLVRNNPDYPGRLYLCGNVARFKSTTSLEQESCTTCSEEFLTACAEDAEKGCATFFSSPSLQSSPSFRAGYVESYVSGLDQADRLRAMRILAAVAQWKSGFHADVRAAERAFVEQYEVAALAAIGAKKRLQRKRRKPVTSVELKVLVEPTHISLLTGTTGFVAPTEKVVQLAAGGNVVQPAAREISGPPGQLFSDAVQLSSSTGEVSDSKGLAGVNRIGSLKALENSETAETAAAGIHGAPASDAEPAAAEYKTVHSILRDYGETDLAGAKRLVAGFRAKCPDCTVEEIVGVIRTKGRRARQQHNPVGWLIEVVIRSADSFAIERASVLSRKQHDDEQLIAAHRLQAQSQDAAGREYSRRWLTERGFGEFGGSVE